MATLAIAPGLWSRAVAAAWLGITERTLDRLSRRDKGVAACVRKIGGRVKYSPAELAKWVEEQKRGAKSKRR